MSKLFFIPFILFSVSGFSQVGINTDKPLAGLDIVTLDADDTTLTTPEGILIPRVSKIRVQQMPLAEEGTVVYVNDISGSTNTPATETIDGLGFYYFKDNRWIKLVNESNDTNIYNLSDILTGNRIVNQNSNTLAFTAGVSPKVNQFSVDENTFSVDAFNDKIGVGTLTPQSKLHIIGDLQFIGALKIGNLGDSGNPGDILMGYNGSSPSWKAAPFDSNSNFTFSNGIQFNPNIDHLVQFGGRLIDNTNINLNGNNFLIKGTNYKGFLLQQYNRTFDPLVSIDFSRNSFGIGASPQRQFHIDDQMYLSGSLYVDNSTLPGNPGVSQQYLTSRGNDLAPTWQSIEEEDINPLVFNNGLNETGSNIVRLGGDLITNTDIETNENALLSISGNANNSFYLKSTDDTNVFSADLTANSTGKRIGILTTDPTNTVDINGNLRIRNVDNETNFDNETLVINSNGDVQKNNSSFADRFVSGSVYVYYLNPSYTEPTEINANPPLSLNKIIGGKEGVLYDVTSSQTAVSRRYGLQYIQGEGYKVSNPQSGIVDIMFDKPYTEVYGASVNIFDTYRSSGSNAYENIVGTSLYPTDNTQISFLSNRILRVKTSDAYGSLANRSFSFTIVGK